MENRVVTCVYCGHEYPDQTPTSGAEVLTAHISAAHGRRSRTVQPLVGHTQSGAK